jgi:DNA invertase Pin-like site-specific DNA recombinase
LDQQLDALTAADVNPKRVYSDKLSGASTREQRPGLASLLDYARPGDAIVVWTDCTSTAYGITWPRC